MVLTHIATIFILGEKKQLLHVQEWVVVMGLLRISKNGLKCMSLSGFEWTENEM